MLTAATRIVVVEPDGYGGLAHFAYQVANALADEGAAVTLLTSRHYELAHLTHHCHLDTSLAMWPNVPQGAPTRSLPRWALALARRLRRLTRGIRLLVVWAGLTRRLIRERPDAIQFSEIRFAILGLFLRRLRRAGLVLTQVCHEYEPREKGPLARRFTLRTSRGLYDPFSVIFFMGNRVRDAFHARVHVEASRTRTIPMGDGSLFTTTSTDTGDLRRRYGLDSDDPVALFFGGLRPSKGIDDLIAAFAGVVRDIPRAKLLVVGLPQAGIRPDAYVEQAVALGIQRSVLIDARYVPVDEVGALMRTADVVALPYRTGSASAVLQVACTFGRAVVVTSAGAVAEAVVDGHTGLVVSPGDRAGLTGALRRLLGDRALASTLGAEARRRSTRLHGWPTIAREILRATEASVALQRSPDRKSVPTHAGL
jgi:glycosyltransferase involved in cell wall biosynthesis